MYFMPEGKVYSPLPCLLPFKKSPMYWPLFFYHKRPINYKLCTFALKITLQIEWAFILIFFLSLSPMKNSTYFLSLWIYTFERVILSFLTSFSIDLIIIHLSSVLKFGCPIISVCIICHVVFQTPMIVGSIGFDVMAHSVCHSIEELSDENRSVAMIHFAEAIWSSSLK